MSQEEHRVVFDIEEHIGQGADGSATVSSSKEASEEPPSAVEAAGENGRVVSDADLPLSTPCERPDCRKRLAEIERLKDHLCQLDEEVNLEGGRFADELSRLQDTIAEQEQVIQNYKESALADRVDAGEQVKVANERLAARLSATEASVKERDQMITNLESALSMLQASTMPASIAGDTLILQPPAHATLPQL